MALASSLAVEPLIPAIACTPDLLSWAEGACIKRVRNAVTNLTILAGAATTPWFWERANAQESSVHSTLRRNWTFAAKTHDEYMLRRYYPVFKATAVNQLWAYQGYIRVRDDGSIQARIRPTWYLLHASTCTRSKRYVGVDFLSLHVSAN
jgi:hypothetical protein